MRIRLREDPGYYSREVKIEGTTFLIKELDDAELELLWDIEAELRAKLQSLGLVPGRNSPVDDPQLLSRLADASRDEIRAVQGLQARWRDHIVTHGLVGWDIPDTPFAPERAALLPNWVKARLAQEVIRDSVVPESVADFLPPQQSQ